MPHTNITAEHRRAFNALSGGRHGNFCLFSSFLSEEPSAAIAAITVSQPETEGGEPEYAITPILVSVTPGMKLADHDGREA